MRNIISFINFFLLGFLVLVLFYFLNKLRYELNIVKKLRALADQYKALVEASTEGIFQVNPEGQFNIINDAGAMILGYDSAQHFLSQNLSYKDLFPDYKKYIKDFRAKLFNAGVQQEQFKVPVANRNSIIIEINAKPRFDEKRELLGVEGIFRDVTERVEMQIQLRHYSEQLEQMVQQKTEENMRLEHEKFDLEKLAAIGQASSTIVHEIRNPLASIKMGLSTLLSRANLNENDENLISIATQEINHLQKMLREILDYSKPQELKCAAQDIHQIIMHLCNQFSELFNDSKVDCHTELVSKESQVFVDFDKINQVFTNIILNAVQAMQNGGQINIQTQVIDKKWIEIIVSDTGNGISKKDLKNVFTPFYSTKARGTGLGLPLVKKIIMGHKGKVDIESTPKSGTTVHIKLPIYLS